MLEVCIYLKCTKHLEYIYKKATYLGPPTSCMLCITARPLEPENGIGLDFRDPLATKSNPNHFKLLGNKAYAICTLAAGILT